MNKFVVAIVGLCVALSWLVVGLPVESLAGSSMNLGGSQLNTPNLFDKVRGIQPYPGACQFDTPGLCGAISRPSAGPGDCPFNSSELCERVGNVSTFDGPFTYDRSRVGARGASSAGASACFPCFLPFHP